MNDGIVFEVDTSRVLSILAREIYDSPLAMLRENLQNAYDAIRMRFVPTNRPLTEGRIDLEVSGDRVVIRDNGVGMTEDVLRHNFWKAGSSGKQSSEARRAGVVGTFGIGAMANFGVCKQLIVRTRTEGAVESLISTAERDRLKISMECISLERSSEDTSIGTTVTAVMDPAHVITADQARRYLEPYVSLLPVPVFLNGTTNISGASMESRLPLGNRNFTRLAEPKRFNDSTISGLFDVSADANGQVLVCMSEITLGAVAVEGSLLLLQAGGQLMGLRSCFGLAPIPCSGPYQFGGFANLSFLQPTAGREAVSRESIDQVSRLVALCERAVSELLAVTTLADKNTAFMQWLVTHGRQDLGDRVSIRVLPDEVDVPLGEVKDRAGSRTSHYYAGADPQILQIFSGTDQCLFHVTQSNPRRAVQIHFLNNRLNIPQVPDAAKVVRSYKPIELDVSEASIIVRVASVLREDYLIPNVEVCLSDISHGVTVLPESRNEQLIVHLGRSSAILPPLKQFFRDDYQLYGSFIKDFVRNQVYPRVQQFVPSSTRDGVDVLRKMLLRNRELYRYEEAEFGELETLLGDYLSGSASMTEVLQSAHAAARTQSQSVTREQVGTVENVFPDVIRSPVPQPVSEEFGPRPPILREEVETEMKILVTHEKYSALNGFTMLLGLSDKLIRSHSDFFRTAHTTRIIWGGHRVIYIFAEASGKLSLYYDIELREPLDDSKASGGMFQTTTLITKKRIFVPVPDALVDGFKITSGPREFYIRFDLLLAN